VPVIKTMYMHAIRYRHWLALMILTTMVVSCYKKEINFGDDPENNYTRLVYTDTISVRHTTVITDSFATNAMSTMLLGKYLDPFLGTVDTRAFFRFSPLASSVEIPVTAVFDSLTIILRLNHYYYGDTSLTQTIRVDELAQTISLSYNDRIYNTSDVPVKPVALGSRTLSIKPVKDDSVAIKLSNTKGLELFNKIVQHSTDITDATEFQNFFKGVRLSVNPNDMTAVFGIAASTGMVMRLHYHHTSPLYENKIIDFPMETGTYSFNQVTPDRSGTGLPSSAAGGREFESSQTNGMAFTQDGTGLLLKMTFPSLRNLLNNDDVVRLLKAVLIVRPVQQSFDQHRYRLPEQLYLATTNGTNAIGSTLQDSSGSYQYIKPMVDFIHGENTQYRFNVTSYINDLLTTAGSSEYGFFLMEDLTAEKRHVTRTVINANGVNGYKTQLLLDLIIINK
jgi:hypothetical protein